MSDFFLILPTLRDDSLEMSSPVVWGKIEKHINLCPAEPGYALPLQTV